MNERTTQATRRLAASHAAGRTAGGNHRADEKAHHGEGSRHVDQGRAHGFHRRIVGLFFVVAFAAAVHAEPVGRFDVAGAAQESAAGIVREAIVQLRAASFQPARDEDGEPGNLDVGAEDSPEGRGAADRAAEVPARDVQTVHRVGCQRGSQEDRKLDREQCRQDRGAGQEDVRGGLGMSKFEFKVRAGQREFERGVQQHRVSGLLARRQYGKTTIASRIAMRKMMKIPGHTVVFGSVKIDLGREIVRKEADALQKTFSMLAADANKGKAVLQAVDDQGKNVAAVNLDDWTELYEQSRLEFRLFHDRTVYSRTKVVALTPEAVGETGDLILDEVGRVRRFGEVLEAMLPIISSNPEFRAIFTTTPPPDDTHPSYDLLAPPIGIDLPVNPKGNWYRSEMGVWVLRITVY